MSSDILGSMDVLSDVKFNGPSAGKVDSLDVKYKNCVIASRVRLIPFIQALDTLSQLALDACARSVYICGSADVVTFKWVNALYKFEFSLPNIAAKDFAPVCVSINSLKHILGNLPGDLILVRGDKPDEVSVLVGSQLVRLDLIPFVPEWFDFEIPVGAESIDVGRVCNDLKVFSTLFKLTSRSVEQLLISKDGYSYIDVGAVAGRSDVFFGCDASVVHKAAVDAVVLLVSIFKGDVKFSIKECEPTEGSTDRATLYTFALGGMAFLQIPVVSGEKVDSFLSPALIGSFSYTEYGCFNVSDLLSVLKLVSTLDYFTQFVRLEFKGSTLNVTSHTVYGSNDTYTFNCTSGYVGSGVLNLEIGTFLYVLSLCNESSRFSVRSGNMLVDTGSSLFFLRSFEG